MCRTLFNWAKQNILIYGMDVFSKILTVPSHQPAMLSGSRALWVENLAPLF